MNTRSIVQQLLKNATSRTNRKQIIEDYGLRIIRSERIDRLINERSKIEKKRRAQPLYP